MFENILEILHYGVLMLFGIYLSAAFLGIRMNRENVLKLLGCSAVLGMINAVCYVMFGLEITEQVYPLIIHLPLIVFLKVIYKHKVISITLAVFVSYLCCQISNWVGVFFLYITKTQRV